MPEREIFKHVVPHSWLEAIYTVDLTQIHITVPHYCPHVLHIE